MALTLSARFPRADSFFARSRKKGSTRQGRTIDSSRCMTKWKLLALALLTALPLLAGCGESMACSTEVTAGTGTFKAVAEGKRPQRELERESLASACKQLCAASKVEATTTEACVSRCSVDSVAGKIGVRTTCSKGAR
jgi:hypothetical protein